MGEVSVPVGAFYGASTQRAKDNFPISNLRFGRDFIWALGLIKGAAADVSGKLNASRRTRRPPSSKQPTRSWPATSTISSCSTSSRPAPAHRPTPTPTKSSPNGRTKSSGPDAQAVHPNDHVNFGQSSNDVIPSAIHVAAVTAIRTALIPALGALAGPCRPRPWSSQTS